MERMFDVLIVGGGVAGMSAAIYAKRSGKNVAIIERAALGGVVGTLNKIENFPSQKEIDGFSLAQLFVKQVNSLEIETIFDDIVSAKLDGETKTVVGKIGQYKAKSLVIATGLSYQELGKNEAEFLGRGVSYCAVCDANFFKGQKVCVVSRKGSGIKDAKYLSNIAANVLVLDEADMSIFAQANTVKNMSLLSNTTIEKVVGKDNVEALECLVGGERKTIKTNGLFVCLGRSPKSEIFGDKLETDRQGFIKTDENMQTSINGVYAVGDVRAGVMKQIVTACSDGAIAGKKATEGI